MVPRHYLTTRYARQQGNRLEAQFAEAYWAWKRKPGPETARQLIKVLRPVIDLAVKTYGGQSANNPALRSKAEVMAIQAMERYDPEKSGLRTFLMSQLRGLQRVGARQAAVIHVPERLALQRRAIEEMESKLADQLGRPPSMLELADRTGISVDKIHAIKASQNLAAMSQVAGDQETGWHLQGAQNKAFRNAWEQLVYYDLDPKSQVIYEYMRGINGRQQLPAKKIAEKLGVTPSAVSQRMRRIQQMLDMESELSPFSQEDQGTFGDLSKAAQETLRKLVRAERRLNNGHQ